MSSAAAVMSGDVQKQVLDTLGQFKTAYDKQAEEIARLGKADSETLVKIDKLTEDMISIHKRHTDEAVKRIDDLDRLLKEQKTAMEPPKSIGDRVIEDPGFLSFIESGSRQGWSTTIKGVRLFMKDITGYSGLLQERLPYVAVGPRLPLGVRTLVPQGKTTAGSLEFVREVSFTNNAAVVAENTLKPKSDKVFETASSTVRTIAHYFKASKQTYEDLPFLASAIESNGIYGVQKVEDQELLNGSGVAPHLMGFNTVATAAPGAAVGGTLIDAIGVALFDLASKGFMPDGVVTNPADWGAVALLKNAQGNYLFANPIEYSAIQKVWGMNRVSSVHQAAGAFLVGAFQGNALLLDREEVNVQVAAQNEDDFIKNMLTILIEERLALVIYTPAAFEKGVVPAPAVGGFSAQPPSATNEPEGRRERRNS